LIHIRALENIHLLTGSNMKQKITESPEYDMDLDFEPLIAVQESTPNPRRSIVRRENIMKK
jgi:hypothetical protein